MKFSYLYWFSMQVAVAPVFGGVRQLSSRTLDICVNEDPTTGFPTANPTGGPTSSPTDGPTGAPTSDPTGAPTSDPTGAPTINPFCATLANLGDGFSGPTGTDHYSDQCYPAVEQFRSSFNGFDDSVSLFVGGDYIGRKANSVEGKVVVLGDLKVKKNGPKYLVSAETGTQVVPNYDVDCVIVGGDISANRNVFVFNQVRSNGCGIVYKGSSDDSERWNTNGALSHEPNYDLTRYENMKHVLASKSQYWKNLSTTGTSGEERGVFTFQCSTSDDVQVFNIYPNDSHLVPSRYVFDNNCSVDKTILINVHGTQDLVMNAAPMYFEDQTGPFPSGFSTCLTQNILWNFPDTASVTIGNSKSSEFHGSLLVGGDLTFSTSGHSGRMLVLGDVIHDFTASDLRSYPFAPPTPLPDPDDVCELPPPTASPTGNPTDGPTGSPTNLPTGSPTNIPTGSPTNLPTNPPFCATLANLGDGFSGATGTDHYSDQCYPRVEQMGSGLKGFDDSVSLFVGGDYIGQTAYSVEGKVVVLGNLDVKSTGPSQMALVSMGSQVVPRSHSDCIIVGGDISAKRNVNFATVNPEFVCKIVYKGSSHDSPRWLNQDYTDAFLSHEPNYDLTRYENMKHVLANKSQYWKTLDPTGLYTLNNGQMRFYCDLNYDVNVINYTPDVSVRIFFYEFDDSCVGKTILLNILGGGNLEFAAAEMSVKNNMIGGFPTCMTQNMLWNFPDYLSVTIAGTEFFGSILVGGDLIFKTPGHHGRMLVLGDMIHDFTASELYSYPFAPPTPLPDPDDVCFLPPTTASPNDSPTLHPFLQPTAPPTIEPEQPDGCIAIPQAQLPLGSFATNDGHCAECEGPNPQAWFPCNNNPPLCYGLSCIFAD